MSQDYIKALSMAEGLGIKVSAAGGGRVRSENLDSDGNPVMAVITQQKLDQLTDELQMFKMIVNHFDNEARRMQQAMNQATNTLQEIARYRLSWMQGELPVGIFDNEVFREVKA